MKKSKTQSKPWAAALLVAAMFLVISPRITWAKDAKEWGPIGPPGGEVRAIAIDPQNPQIIYAGKSRGGVYKSIDGGDSWTAMNAGLSDLRISSLAIDPSNSQNIYAGGERGGMYKSVDGGNSWTAISMGVGILPITSLAIDPSDSGIIYAGALKGERGKEYSEIYKSVDGGDSWSVMNTGMDDFFITALAVDPADSKVIYAGTIRRETNRSLGGGVRKSVDGGDSWTVSNRGMGDQPITSLAIDPSNSSLIYAGTSGRSRSGGSFYRSVNGGSSWRITDSGLEYSAVFDLEVDPSDSRIIFAGSRLGVYRSTNGGKSWAAFSEATRQGRLNSACVNNLKQIGLVLKLFAEKNSNRMPNSFAELYPKHVNDKIIFVCPARRGKFKSFDEDYKYIPGLQANTPKQSEQEIVIERAGNHSDPVAYHILYLDGHVERRDSTELVKAAREGRAETVETLLAKGADVNAKQNDGTTALIAAADRRHTEIAQALLAGGADVNAKRTDGATALMIAMQRRSTEMAQALLARGADVNAKTHEGITVLMIAAAIGSKELVEELLAKGADVNAKTSADVRGLTAETDNAGATALMVAAHQGHAEIVQLLKDAGAKE